MNLQYHYNDLKVKKTDHHLHLLAADSNSFSITIVYQEETVDLEPGKSIKFPLKHLEIRAQTFQRVYSNW